jgi:PadR family transcriptional regulator, regulatory protein AphA
MALSHMLLGLLADRPSNGYYLQKRFFHNQRPPLPQVYRALHEMAKNGFIKVEKVRGKSQRSQYMCAITDAGYAELDRWIKTRSGMRPTVEAFMSRLWFASLFNKEDLISCLKAYVDKKKEELDYGEGKGKTFYERGVELYGTSPQAEFYHGLFFDYWVKRLTADIKWLEEAVDKISKYKEASPPSKARRATAKSTSVKSKAPKKKK